MKTKTYLLFILLALINIPAVSQIPVNIPSKEDRYAKKIEKSPARDEIKNVESNITQLDKLITRQGDITSFGLYESLYSDFEKPYLAIKNGVPAILAKDPKWKVEEYNTKLADYTKKYDEINVVYAKTKRINAL